MKVLKTRAQSAFLQSEQKTRKQFGIGLALILLSSGLCAQPSSHDANSIPIFPLTANNTAFGLGALISNATGFDNAAAGYNALYSNISGRANTATGHQALFSNDAGGNSAHGYRSLFSNTSGQNNTATGNGALFLNNGDDNVAHGGQALYNNATGNENTANGTGALFTNSSGSYNTATGTGALYYNDADANVATGYQALYSNATGTWNVATGYKALFSNISGNYNTADGARALYWNTTGLRNTAIGHDALYLNNGDNNVACGYEAMIYNTSGVANTACGMQSLFFNDVGSLNTAVGHFALRDNLADQNTAIGYNCLIANTAGVQNSAGGAEALAFNSLGDYNTAFGYRALYGNTVEDYNTGLGYYADMVWLSGNTNATAIGAFAQVTASNKIRLGDANLTICEIAAAAVYTGSDGRFKTNLNEEDVKGLDFIKRLRPVVYNFDTKKFTEFTSKNLPDTIKIKYVDRDFSVSTAIRHSGFIAQEVEKAAQESGYNFDAIHKPESDKDNYSLAYSQFVVPLVKAVQEQQAMIEEQKIKNDQLQQQLEEQKQLITDLQNKTSSATGLNQNTEISGFTMSQNEPNPFTHETVIKYNLPQATGSAYMAVYDLSGKQITKFALDQKGASFIMITSEKLAAGIYIYSIVADGKVMDSKKMIVADK
jgi:hypothetical protein